MKFLKYLLLLFATVSFSSCLEGGLDDLPVYDEANIKGIKFEYRWMVKEGTGEKLSVKSLNTSYDINEEASTVTCNITVPAAGGQFTEEVRDKVSLKNLNAFCTISTAATMKPLGSAPVLGKIGDFSQQNMEYEVTAADGKTKKVWKLVIASFNK